MIILDFLKNYWVLITFFVGEIGALIVFAYYIITAVKCLLRNDILTMYDKCKESKKMTKYQSQSVHLSYEIYKKLKGNSFVKDIMDEIEKYEIL